MPNLKRMSCSKLTDYVAARWWAGVNIYYEHGHHTPYVLSFEYEEGEGERKWHTHRCETKADLVASIDKMLSK